MESTSFREITAFSGHYRTMQSSHVRSPERRDLNANQDVRLDTDGEQLFYRVLSGLVLTSPDAAMYGTSVRCIKGCAHGQFQQPSGESLRGTAGFDITYCTADFDQYHVMTFAPSSTRSLIALVMCGITCTVARGSHRGVLYAERQSRYDPW